MDVLILNMMEMLAYTLIGTLLEENRFEEHYAFALPKFKNLVKEFTKVATLVTMKKGAYIMLALVLILGYVMYVSNKAFVSGVCKNCVVQHSQHGNDYGWLNVLGHGKVLKVEFKEPVDKGTWRLYDDKWWGVHCGVIDHRPNYLVESHVKAFVDTFSRFAIMRFTFEDGTVMEPTKYFFELEADYFRKEC